MQANAKEFVQDWREYLYGDMSQEELCRRYKLDLLPGDDILEALFQKFAEDSHD